MNAMGRQNTWMIGDIDVNSISIESFDDLLRYLFVVFCVKKDIKIEFSLWSNPKAKEEGFFVSYDEQAKQIIEHYFINKRFLEPTFEDDHTASDEMYKYQEFYEALEALPVGLFIETCPKLFDKLCELYYKRNRAFGAVQPAALSRFVCSILTENNCKSIYNPFSGLCSYSICMEEDVLYRGQEKDFEIFQIAQLRLDAYNKTNSLVYNEDAISKLEGSFDAVVATPPFGGYFKDESSQGKRVSFVESFIQMGMKSGASLCICIAPSNFLSVDQYRYLRKELVSKKCIESIVLFPSGVFSPNTSISTIMLVLRPKGGCKYVTYIDAVDCFAEDKREIDLQHLLDLWHVKNVDSTYKVDVDEIGFMDCDLSLDNYEVQRIEEKDRIIDVVRMGDIAISEAGEMVNSGNLMSLLKDSDFCDNILKLSSTKDVDNKFENNEGGEYLRFVGPRLVINDIDGKLCCYLHRGENAFCFPKNKQYLVLKLEQSIIDPLYLASFFFQNGVVSRKTMNLLHFHSVTSITIQNTRTIYVSDVAEDDCVETTFDFLSPSIKIHNTEIKKAGKPEESGRGEKEDDNLSKKSFLDKIVDVGGRLVDSIEKSVDNWEGKGIKCAKSFVSIRLGISGIAEQSHFVESTITQQRIRIQQELQAERERWGIRETTSDIVHMLGRPFSKQQNIIGFLKSHKPVDAGYEDAVVALADISNFIRRLVTSVGGDFSKYDYKKEDVALSSFVQEYVRSWNNFAVKDFDLEVEDNVGANTIVSMDKDTMMILLDAALDNAWRHGFKKQKKDGNKVCVALSVVDWDGNLYVDMQIGNNGAIIEPGLSNEVFISKGRFSKYTGRTGLGGNHIYQIAKKHDGFLSVSGGGKWSFCIDVLLPIKSYDEYISFEPVSHKLFFV